MDELKIFEGVGGVGKGRKIILPITEGKEEPVFIRIDYSEGNNCKTKKEKEEYIERKLNLK